jgi:mitochondrial fission protein ELM1
VPPRTWLLLGDKRGDNGQVETIVEVLGWPVERRFIQPLPQWVYGKPRYRPTLEHLDLERSDPLQAPWPELIITIGRRPSMAALWVREQSGGRTKIALVGKPSGLMREFDLVISSAENQMPPLPNLVSTTLPFMRVDGEAVAAEAARWAPRFAALPLPLVAILIGGETNPFVMDARAAKGLVAEARRVIEESGGTPYVTTSRRTTQNVVDVLKEELPAQARLFTWTPDAAPEDNPYRALLGGADTFVVTGDSISMMVEVLRLKKPLAIFPLPSGRWGRLDLWRRSLASWLFNPRRATAGDRLRHSVARGVYYLDVFKLLSATRDFRAFHRLLVDSGLAVWAGSASRPPKGSPPDDLELVTQRIRGLFAGRTRED